MLSEKYSRTYHFPFSPGTTSDDRINHTYWEDIQRIDTLVYTEKLDGENNCLNSAGVFARSHAAPATSPWTRQLRERCCSGDGVREVFPSAVSSVRALKSFMGT